jgi:hypothetical protein
VNSGDQRSTINGYARTVRDLLSNRRYGLEFYQREYSWENTQVEELLTDLTSRFGEQRDPSHTRKSVANYRPYFLGPIITSQRDGTGYLIDGQQRLTSLSLLLIHLLHRLDGHEEIQSLIRPCISSVKYGEHSFTLDVPEREPVMKALVRESDFDPEGASASVRTSGAVTRTSSACWSSTRTSCRCSSTGCWRRWSSSRSPRPRARWPTRSSRP